MCGTYTHSRYMYACQLRDLQTTCILYNVHVHCIIQCTCVLYNVHVHVYIIIHVQCTCIPSANLLDIDCKLTVKTYYTVQHSQHVFVSVVCRGCGIMLS